MKTKTNTQLYALTLLSAVVTTTNTQASSDYGPAIWNPACNGHWYTSGYGHKFHVIHDMEGYYLSTISYFQNCNTQASVHYCVNGLQDTGTDHPAGEITQMVLEAYYAWHVLCWNTYCTGTEHEGFVSNPAWYTEAQYVASAGITSHIASKFGFAKDRNHIVGHNEWQNANWRSYASANFGINPNCNTHTDPGVYWDWSHYMALVNPPPPPPPLVDGNQRIKGDFNGDGKEDVVISYDQHNSTLVLYVLQSTGTSFTTALWWQSAGWNPAITKWVAGDFDGDGKSDVVGLYRTSASTCTAYFFRSTGTNFAAPVVWWQSTGWAWDNTKWVSGDFNGDGKTDVAGLYKTAAGTTTAYVLQSTGTNLVQQPAWWQNAGWAWDNTKWVAGDFNNDGKTDIAGIYDNGNVSISIYALLSTGSAFGQYTWWTTTPGAWDWKHSTFEAGNFDGSGKRGLAGVYDYGSPTMKIWMFASTGSAFTGPALWYSTTSWNAQLSKWMAGDFDGDGKTDVAALYNSGYPTTTLWTFLSSGSAFPAAAQWWYSGGWDWTESTPF